LQVAPVAVLSHAVELLCSGRCQLLRSGGCSDLLRSGCVDLQHWLRPGRMRHGLLDDGSGRPDRPRPDGNRRSAAAGRNEVMLSQL
jgi:hypothetical protein